MRDLLQSISDRYANYLQAPVSTEISEHDDMFAHDHDETEARDHYLSVGRSAIDVIAKVMVASGKTSAAHVLDLPCGGGRVTRQLATFFPEAKLYVGDVNKKKERAVVAAFGAKAVEPNIDFSADPEPRFDLIWVGSLLTHLNIGLFRRALRWYMASLAPEGVLIVTTHGRRHETLQAINPHVPPERWAPASASLRETGFGFVPYDENNAADPLEIGTTVSSPAWIMRLIEADPSVRLVAFHEAGWADAQDVVAVQKIAI